VDLINFLIDANASLREALMRIETNHRGIIFLTDCSGSVIGLATDGDIRRKLLEGASLNDPILLIANTKFTWAATNTPREILLKKLNHRIKVIPILDAMRSLKGIVSRDHLPIQAEERVYARSRSPVRISFGGGGSDITHYFVGDGGAVINTAISLYSHATLRLRADEKIKIHSRDIGESFSADNLASSM